MRLQETILETNSGLVTDQSSAIIVKVCPKCNNSFNTKTYLTKRYCSIQCFNTSSEKRQSNRMRQLGFVAQGWSPWNKGLTKETSEIIAANSEIWEKEVRKNLPDLKRKLLEFHENS